MTVKVYVVVTLNVDVLSNVLVGIMIVKGCVMVMPIVMLAIW